MKPEPSYRLRPIPGLPGIVREDATVIATRVHKQTLERLKRIAKRMGLTPSSFARIELEAAIGRMELMLPDEQTGDPEPQPGDPSRAA